MSLFFFCWDLNLFWLSFGNMLWHPEDSVVIEFLMSVRPVTLKTSLNQNKSLDQSWRPVYLLFISGSCFKDTRRNPWGLEADLSFCFCFIVFKRHSWSSYEIMTWILQLVTASVNTACLVRPGTLLPGGGGGVVISHAQFRFVHRVDSELLCPAWLLPTSSHLSSRLPQRNTTVLEMTVHLRGGGGGSLSLRVM